MIDNKKEKRERSFTGGDQQAVNSVPFSRRSFLAKTSCFGAFYAVARLIPLPALAAELSNDSRVSPTPLVDKGFASVRKVGNGLYATISDPSKGITTICNGGFLAGKDGALLLEGFGSPSGASFQMDALRMVSQVPVKGALDTHYHFDHSMGNSFYGANGVQLWAHATTAKRIVENYLPMQGTDKAAALAPFEKRVKDAKSDTERQHAQSDLNAVTGLFQIASVTVIGLPNHPIDAAKLPLSLDLGGLTAVIESYPGHSGTDMIVRVPEQNVVYAGDLLFSGWYPVCFDEKATVSGWRDTLKKFTSPVKPRKCSRQASLPKKRSTATWCPISSRISPFIHGDSQLARQLPSSMRSGRESKRLWERVFETVRRTSALPVWPGPNPPRQPIDRHYRCGLHPARFPEVSEAILLREDHRGSLFSAHPVKTPEIARPT